MESSKLALIPRRNKQLVHGWIRQCQIEYKNEYPQPIHDLCLAFLNAIDCIVISIFDNETSMYNFKVFDQEIIQIRQSNKFERSFYYFQDKIKKLHHLWVFQIISPNIYDNDTANGMVLFSLQEKNLNTQYSWSIFQPFIERKIRGKGRQTLEIDQKYQVHSGDIIQILFDGIRKRLHFKNKNGTKKLKNVNIKGIFRMKITIIPWSFKYINIKLLSYKMIY